MSVDSSDNIVSFVFVYACFKFYFLDYFYSIYKSLSSQRFGNLSNSFFGTGCLRSTGLALFSPPKLLKPSPETPLVSYRESPEASHVCSHTPPGQLLSSLPSAVLWLLLPVKMCLSLCLDLLFCLLLQLLFPVLVIAKDKLSHPRDPVTCSLGITSLSLPWYSF